MKSKISKYVIWSILALMLIPQFALAATHSVRNDLGAFVLGFQALFNGNVGGFVGGLVFAMPLFGVVLMIFGLGYYLSLITIFRNAKGVGTDGNHKYAKIFGVGLALIGLGQQSVYNSILGLSTALITIIFLLAAIFMFWMFMGNLRTSNAEIGEGLYKAKEKHLTEERKFKKLEHEVLKDKKMHRKSEHLLGSLSDDLNDVYRLTGSEKKQIQDLIKYLSKISQAHASQDKTKEHNYIKMFDKQIGALMTTMRHEDLDLNKAQKLLTKIRGWSKYTLKDIKNEKEMETKINEVLSNTSEDIKKNKDVRDMLKELIKLSSSLVHYENHLRKQISEIGRDNKHTKASSARGNVSSGNYKAALDDLDDLNNILDKEEDIDANIKDDVANIEHFLRNIRDIDKQLGDIVN